MTNLEKPRIAIIGAGMAGILSGIKLAEAGFDDFTIYEKADRVGGTWRENSYPGLSCDVPSHLYSYSFAPNAEWSRRFSPGPEIQAYFEEMTRRYSLESHIAFDTEVKRCSFEDGRWKIETADGDIEFAHFVIAATGVLHHPSLPDIPDLDRFEGKVFHSARWDHDVSIDDKRVGIIGTGSTAVQIVSALVDRVAKLSVFQRTPQWIMPQENPAYDEEEKAAFRAEPERMRALREDISRLFADNFANAVVDADSPQMKLIEQLCRENLDASVADPELRERLRPDYRAACKRLVISPDFYHAMQQPNVDLVTESISGAEASGLRTRDGALHELDVLVLATGFRVDRFMRPIEVRGRNGVALEDVWRDRPTAYLAIAIPDFPNLFMLNGPNGPVGNFSLIEVAEMQIAYILKLMEWVRGGDCREVSVRKRASEQFDRERTEAARNTVWATGCRSWYLDDRGIPAVWPWTFDRFKQEMSRPDPEHFERV